MKKLLLVALLAIGISAASKAQGPPPQKSPAEQVTLLKTQVAGITDAQAAKILTIYTAQTKSRDSIVAGGDFSAMRPLRAATNAKIKAQLTADQQKQFDAIPPQGRGPGGPPPTN